MKKLISLVVVLLFSFSLFGQTETFDGELLEVAIWGTNDFDLEIKRSDTGEIIMVRSTKYIRNQSKFTIQGDTLNVIPPPLHVTDTWTAEGIIPDAYAIYVDTSEPATVKLFLREHRWEGTDRFWYEQALPSSLEHHTIGIPLTFNFGINWAWDYYVVITNESGETFTTPIITFKNKDVDIQILNDNQPNKG